tara:strand:+ start:492 stop:1565 length:1074 start_codon:yes stop_codon:yes gene_type:complete
MTLARELADTAGRPQVDKNLLINGGMNIWQRSTSASVTNVGYYTADRWRSGGTGLGVFTQSRSTDVPSAQGFGYSLKMDCTTADASPAASDNRNIQHRIEGQNLQHLLKGTSSSKAVTLSFWVKSNKTGTYIIEIADVDNTRHICKSYTIDTASTWEKKELVFDGDTLGTLDNDNASSLEILWYLGVGSNRSSGTLATSWATRTDANKAVGQVNLADSTSNEWYMTGCQLEVGEAATDFQFEPYASTLEKCQRYYFEQREGGIFGIANTTNVNFRVPLSVTMRAAPSASLGGSGNFRIGDMISQGFSTSSPSIVVNYNGPTIAGVRVSGFSGLTAYRTYLLEPSGSSLRYIKLDAEL